MNAMSGPAKAAMLLSSLATIGAASGPPVAPSSATGSLTVQLPIPIGASAPGCGAEPWLHLVETLAWPLVIVFLAWRFRTPLGELVRGIGGRVSKVSLFNVAVEFATAQPSEQTPLLEEIRDPARSAPIVDSAAAMAEQVQSSVPADYALIDLGSGEEWLTSRLYIAAVMMERMRGISAFVFVSRTAASEQHYVTTADVRLLRWSLAMRYPWLENAFAAAYAALFQYETPLAATTRVTTTATGALPPYQAQQLVQAFISSLQQQAGTPMPDAGNWVSLGHGEQERAHWVTAPLLNQILPPPVTETKVDELADQPRTKRMRAVLRAHAPFVAVVGRDGQFLRLLDRRAYLEKLATTLGDEPE